MSEQRNTRECVPEPNAYLNWLLYLEQRNQSWKNTSRELLFCGLFREEDNTRQDEGNHVFVDAFFHHTWKYPLQANPLKR